jgi:DNA-binding Lrp family transcriptional regulator
MDTIDRKILNLINNGLPLDQRPFHVVARSVGISEEETIERINKLKGSGIIRRIGAVLNPRSIGWESTLCAADIPMDRLEAFADFVGRFTEVTHNYLRKGNQLLVHPHIPNSERLAEIIDGIEKAFAVKLLNLPARKSTKSGLRWICRKSLPYLNILDITLPSGLPWHLTSSSSYPTQVK